MLIKMLRTRWQNIWCRSIIHFTKGIGQNDSVAKTRLEVSYFKDYFVS